MILIIDDDHVIRTSLSFVLKKAGYEIRTAASPSEAMEIVRTVEPRLVLMDMNFSLSTTGEEGLLLLKQTKLFRPHVPVILITAWGSINLAVQGMQAGAFDFITKPWDNASLLQHIKTALDLTNQKTGMAASISTDDFDRSQIIGTSKPLMKVIETARRIAPTNASVLITGESGTGKELIAEAIHRNSLRTHMPFIKVNLGGISQSLFESEMFGHKKGAFTDAVSDRTGRFEKADKGTIFLDEIGELDISCQVKLLRVLQEQTFEVLGDSRPRKVDIRVICATNADLPKMVKERTFREDLYYRINLISIHVPPLRERREDIPLLVKYFIEKHCQANQIPSVTVTKEALDFLSKLPYMGNVRELKNLVERTLFVSPKEMLDASDFETHYHGGTSIATDFNLSGMTLDEIEKHSITESLSRYNNNITQVANALGISRPALYRRMDKFDIKINE